MNLTGFDYYADRPDPAIGLTRTAHLIRQAREQAENALVLLFDNGDSLQGTPFGDWAMQQDGPHPLMQAFDALGYDAIGLGNHDFEFGLDALERVLKQSTCPVLCSNLLNIHGAPVWQRSAVLDRTVAVAGENCTVRIGVFSVLPPQTTRWESHLLNGALKPLDILSCAAEMVSDLRNRGCDLIIALAHSGLAQAEAAPELENAVIPLAGIDGIDAIVAGHTHLTLPGLAHEGMPHVDHAAGLVHDVPVVMAGSAGSHLGVIDLFLDRGADGRWTVQRRTVDLPTIRATSDHPAVPVDQTLVQMFDEGHRRTRQIVSEPVARVDKDLHSYFSYCAPDHGMALVAAAQAAALRPYLTDPALTDLPVLSAVSPCKSGGRSGPRHYTDVPAGEICVRHIADLHVFPNELRAVIINGEQLLNWLEMAAGAYNHLGQTPGTELINPARAGYTLDLLFGAHYGIDPSRPRRFDDMGDLIAENNRRIINPRVNGRPVTPDQTYIVALNNYRASGGGHYTCLDGAERIDLPPLDIKRILRDYLTGRLHIDPLQNATYPFYLCPPKGTRAVLRTGPASIRYLPELDGFEPRVLGQDEDGFQRIRLTL